MPTNVIMPQLGESVVEGTVSRWLKQVGDRIEAFEPLLEVSTDKVDTEIPAPAEGVLTQILIPEGETVERGTVLAVIAAQGEMVGDGKDSTNGRKDAKAQREEHNAKAQGRDDATGDGTDSMDGRKDAKAQREEQEVEDGIASTQRRKDAKAQREEQAVGVSSVQPTYSNGTAVHDTYTGHVTPVVARMAAEHHLDLARIDGTGRDGRVTKKDVEAYLASRARKTEAVEVQEGAITAVDPWEQPVEGDLFKPTSEYGDELPTKTIERPQPHAPIEVSAGADADGELLSVSPMRRAIADHMVRSKLHTSPHVTTVFEIDLSAVMAHREANKADFAKQEVNLTLTAYFVMAAAAALRAAPMLNAEWREDGIFVHREQNIGIAVALDDGLIVPVIKRAGDLNLLGTARAVNDLAKRARSKQLHPDEVRGGTFSITNHGITGSLFATPILNQPQVGILGVGVVEKRVKVITDAHGGDVLAIRPCVYASLTFDHRVVDGAVGDGFLAHVKAALEEWSSGN